MNTYTDMLAVDTERDTIISIKHLRAIRHTCNHHFHLIEAKPSHKRNGHNRNWQHKQNNIRHFTE